MHLNFITAPAANEQRSRLVLDAATVIFSRGVIFSQEQQNAIVARTQTLVNMADGEWRCPVLGNKNMARWRRGAETNNTSVSSKQRIKDFWFSKV